MMQSYSEFRDQIVKGNLKLYKNELIHILYKKYIYLLRSVIKHLIKKLEDNPEIAVTETVKYCAAFDDILRHKIDFCTDEYPIYKKELNYLEQILKGFGRTHIECFKHVFYNDEYLKQIMSNNFLLFISQHAYNVLETVQKLKKNGHHHELLEELKPNIKIASNLTLEAYTCCPYIPTEMRFEEILKINNTNFFSGVLRDDFVYYGKLEDLYKKKCTKDDSSSAAEQAAQALPPPNSSLQVQQTGQPTLNLLGKRDPTNSATVSGLQSISSLEIKKHQVEKSLNTYMLNIPEIKLSYKIEYAKDYLDKKAVDHYNEPDILKVTLQPAKESVTVVETNLIFKVLLVGYSDGRIKSFYLFEESAKDVEMDKPAPSAKTNLETILDTDINEAVDSIKECTYIGHSRPITCLTLNYDSYYFLSGSADCTVRLWSLKLDQCLAVYKGHHRSITSLKLNPKGFHFASGGADGLIFLWLTNRSKLCSIRLSSHGFHKSPEGCCSSRIQRKPQLSNKLQS